MSDKGRPVKDIVSAMLNDIKKPVNPRHVHVFRKEYKKCLIKYCEATPSGRAEDSRYA